MTTQFAVAVENEQVDDAIVTRDVKATTATSASNQEDEAPVATVDEPVQEDDVDAVITTPKGAAAAAAKPKRNVHFAEADIVEFEPTMFTATVASDGVPVGLSTNVRRRTRRRLDSFEGERRLYRVSRQEYMENGYLEPDERLEMLESAGHSVTQISLVERESVRINRERWESNEYDLLYQYGLGETAMLDLDEEDELLLSEGTIARHFNNQEMLDDDDDDAEMLEDSESTDIEPLSQYYYYNNKSALSDAESRFGMDDMDAYESRKYDEWAWDYTADCILGDNDQGDELPYAQDSFDADNSSFDLSEMSSSPSDVSSPTDCMIVSCSNVGKIVGSGASASSSSSSRMII